MVELNMNGVPLSALVVAVLLGSTEVSHAEGAMTPYASLAQAAPARITIGQAILIAEREVGGEAVEAELDDDHGRLVYEVDVVKGTQEFEIIVSPETGEILSVEKDD